MTMKNIHILPTEHTSRLYYNSQERTYQLCEFPKYHTDIKSTHNLHITSAVEGVYDKDYYLYEGSVFQARPRDEGNFKNKVILTTDTDLIKDGVQAIDDEFLEWFVSKANDSGKPIDIVEVEGHIYKGQDETEYKIIIPKEEPKQETLTYTESAKKEERIFNSTMMFKQERVEEAALNFANSIEGITPLYRLNVKETFIRGAKWQQERSYSQLDVVRILSKYETLSNEDFNQWFEQFKKK